MTKPESEPKTVRVRFRGPAHVLEVGSRRLERDGDPVDIPAGTYRRLAKNPHVRLDVVRSRKADPEPPTTKTPDSGDQQTG